MFGRASPKCPPKGCRQTPPDRLNTLIDPQTAHLHVGYHWLTWSEFEEALGFNEHRSQLLGGLREMLSLLFHSGCREVLIGGSFASPKPDPADIDGVWISDGVDPAALGRQSEAVLVGDLDVMRQQFGAELLAASWSTMYGQAQIAFFQRSRTGVEWGLIAIDLSTMLLDSEAEPL